jgi:hypothetical protein
MQNRTVTAPLAFLFGASLVAMLALGLWIGGRRPGEERPTAIAVTPELLRRVQDLNQLVTVRYVIDKVVLVEDVKWYGENRLLMVAHGVVNAGIDLSKVGADRIDVAEGRVRIRIPRPRVLDVYLDDRRTQVVERATGLLRDFDKDLEQNARVQALDEIRVAAREGGILKDAEERARKQLESLFRAAGFTEVRVVAE